MAVNFPSSLDDNDTLYDVVNDSTTVKAEHHDNLKDAIIAIETKLGTDAIGDTPVSGDVLYGTGTGTSGWGVLGKIPCVASGVYPLGQKQGAGTNVLRVETQSAAYQATSSGYYFYTVTWSTPAFSATPFVVATVESEIVAEWNISTSLYIYDVSTTVAKAKMSRSGNTEAHQARVNFLAIGY